MKSVAIIGAGIGGLSTGVELLLKGYNVSIYEKNSRAGGVLQSINSPNGEFRFEESASIPINPDTYGKFFKRLGLNPSEYFDEEKLDTLYNVYFHNGKTLRVPHNIESMRTELQKNFREDVEGWDKFMDATMKKYQIAKKYFLNRPFMTVSSVLNPKLLCKLVELNPFTSSSHYVNQFIKSEELRNFILFQAFFMGIATDKLPNVYTTVYANSQVEGISHIKGGLSSYAGILAQIFEDKGGKIYYNSTVKKILGKGEIATGVQIGNETIKSHIVVVNGDYCYAQKELLGRELKRYSELSCSTFIIHLGLTKKFLELGVHNLFINKNFEDEIKNIFKGKLPQNPSLYIYSPSLIDDSYCKDPSHSVVNLMLRVPNLKDLPISWDEATREQMYTLCLKAVSSIKGLENIKDCIGYRRKRLFKH